MTHPRPPVSRGAACVLLAAALTLAASGAGIQAAAARSQSRYHGTASFALPPGIIPTYILPFISPSAFQFNDQEWFEWLMWRPLYWFGRGAAPVVNPSLSLASLPTYSNGGRTVTITLKRYLWSDGHPVTTRDVAFWINLERFNKAHYGAYVPGGFPDNLVSARYSSARTFSLTFNRPYNRTWLLYNELSQITPMPQHVWDRTGPHSPVGRYDLTAAGAARVFTFLDLQSKTLSTYATNPLWRVVDGPWRLARYVPVTGFSEFSPNPLYSGPIQPRLAHFEEVPFTSSTSELDALRAGTVDYGYLPLSALPARKTLEGVGYRLVPWPQYGWTGVLLQYSNGLAGRILAQLPVRQAMMHLLDMHRILAEILHGYGTYFSGPVPTSGPFANSADRTDPYPYSVAAARQVLRSHGWTVRPDGVTSCARPGEGAADCGPGVSAGAPLRFTFLVPSGDPSVSIFAQYVESTFAAAGIKLTIRETGGGSWLSTVESCSGTTRCSWNLAYTPSWWPYAPDYYPTGGEQFKTGASGNAENYSNPALDHLITLSHELPGLAGIYAYQDAVVRLQPALFTPDPDFELAMISTKLEGALPQSPLLDLTPENWTLRS